MKPNKLHALLSIWTLTSVLFVFSHQVRAEEVAESGGSIKGMVIDANSKMPVEYATVAIFTHSSDTPLTGTLSETGGRFRIAGLNQGTFDVVISFMGYETRRYEQVVIRTDQMHVNLGNVVLKPSTETIQQVDVVATRNSVEYKIDKKIVNVSKQLAAASMTAVEVLENVPSVKVDLDGNVALRGSSSFTVLIDGRPTVLEASEALKQIPASSIENIEIITNPSVKYAPDGTAGIINVILKKNRSQGIQGQVSANVGLDDKYGADLLLNLRKNKLNFSVGANYNKRYFPGYSFSDRSTFNQDSVYNVIANGTGNREFSHSSIRLGLDYDLTEKDVISIGSRLGSFRMNNTSDLAYLEKVYFQNNLIEEIESKNIQKMTRDRNFYSVNGSWQHNFDKKGHQLLSMIDYSDRKMGGGNRSELTNTSTQTIRNDDDADARRTEVKIDYTKPFGTNNRLEAGFQGRFDHNTSETQLYLNNTLNQDFSNSAVFDQGIYSLYASYSGKVKNLGYQAGLRTELTDREIEVNETQENFQIHRWDFFPTFFLSYQLPKENQVMASYTRRISRQREWFFFPYLQYVDAYNVRRGDPLLAPELIDSYELNYIKQFKKAQLSIETFYRVTHDKTEFILDAYQGNIAIQRPVNIGKDYSLGIEGNYNMKVTPWWEPTLMGSLYRYKVDTFRGGAKSTRESTNWDVRFNNNFMLYKGLLLQTNLNYSSPTVNSQGSTEGYYSIDAAMRMDFFNRKFSAVIQARDLFQTAIRKSTIDTDAVQAYTKEYMKAPIVTLTFTYRINDFRPKRSQRSPGGEEMGNDEF